MGAPHGIAKASGDRRSRGMRLPSKLFLVLPLALELALVFVPQLFVRRGERLLRLLDGLHLVLKASEQPFDQNNVNRHCRIEPLLESGHEP